MTCTVQHVHVHHNQFKPQVPVDQARVYGVHTCVNLIPKCIQRG